MDLNLLVFPSPSLEWNYQHFLGDFVFIPAKKDKISLDAFNRRMKEKVEKGETPGWIKEPTEKKINKNKKKILRHLKELWRNSANYTDDMDEEVISGRQMDKKALDRNFTNNMSAHLKNLNETEESSDEDSDIKSGEAAVNGGKNASGAPQNYTLVLDDEPTAIRTIERANVNPKPSKMTERTGGKEYDEFVDSMIDHYIPCMLIPPKKLSESTNSVIIYYHANAEDIGQAHDLCYEMNETLNVRSCHLELYPFGGIPRVRNL